MPKTNKNLKKQDFETSVKELEKIIEKMESGKLSLSDSLTSFEQGIAITNHCQELLTTAKQKVEILMEAQENKFEDFELDDSLEDEFEED